MRHGGRALGGLVLGAVWLAACGGGLRDERPDVALSDPGTPLGEGNGGPAGPTLATRGFPSPDPGPAPEGTAALLPTIAGAPSPRAGEPFEPETDCAEAGYTRLRLPDGAELASRGQAFLVGDLATVVSVSDPHTVLPDLATQLDPTGSDAGEGSARVERIDAGYGQVWRLTADVSAGGGSCEACSSADGTAVLITMHND